MSAEVTHPTTRQIGKVAFASIIGSVIEQFDFLVTDVIAATVWGDVFFKLPDLAALAILAIAGTHETKRVNLEGKPETASGIVGHA